VARWEKIPDRREPFTIEMFKHLDSLRQVCSPISIIPVITDWAGCGLYGGFRLTEWAQDDSHSVIDNPLLEIHSQPKAFCLGDLAWKTGANHPLSLAAVLQKMRLPLVAFPLLSRPKKMGRTVSSVCSRAMTVSRLCVLCLFLRITKRFLRFLGEDYSKPLCICRDALGKLRYVTASDVNFVFRLAATQVYTLDPSANKALLDRWSSHSLRVGACVILHAMGFTDTQIMWLLHWKSNAFMMYLRNVAVLAHMQNIAFSEVEAMPQII
jgi:hypothetical protein